MWVRGLKRGLVALHRDLRRSHPMWVRGLKQVCKLLLNFERVSHPMWVRGLKRHTYSKGLRPKRRTLCGCVD